GGTAGRGGADMSGAGEQDRGGLTDEERALTMRRWELDVEYDVAENITDPALRANALIRAKHCGKATKGK
ncbi:MAG TPA: hypothetical protein VF874_19645, partial [Mycobacterium sp.]